MRMKRGSILPTKRCRLHEVDRSDSFICVLVVCSIFFGVLEVRQCDNECSFKSTRVAIPPVATASPLETKHNKLSRSKYLSGYTDIKNGNLLSSSLSYRPTDSFSGARTTNSVVPSARTFLCDCSNMLAKKRFFRIKQYWTQRFLGNHVTFGLRPGKDAQCRGTCERQGTKFSFRQPTPERIAKWFPSTSSAVPSSLDNYYDESSDNNCPGNDGIVGLVGRSLLHKNNPFNHDNAGMTNPTIQISSNESYEKFSHTDMHNVGTSDSFRLRTSPTTRELINSDMDCTNDGIGKVVHVLSPRVSLLQRRRQCFQSEDSVPLENQEHRRTLSLREAVLFPYESAATLHRTKGDSDSKSKSVSFREHTNRHNEEITNQCWWPSSVSVNHNTPESSWRVRRYRKRVGYGTHVYNACRDAALQWDFKTESNDKGIVSIPESNKASVRDIRSVAASDYQNNRIQQISSGPGRRLVTYTTSRNFRNGWKLPSWMPSIYAINPVQVVYDIVDHRGFGSTYTSTAYGTTHGHAMCGEERVTVCLRDHSSVLHPLSSPSSENDQAVDIEILSYSRPSKTAIGRLIWPFIGKLQDSFFIQQLNSFERVAKDAAASSIYPFNCD